MPALPPARNTACPALTATGLPTTGMARNRAGKASASSPLSFGDTVEQSR